MNVTESQTRLCPSQICTRKGASTESRLSSLYSRCADRVSAPARAARARGPAAGDRRVVGELRRRTPRASSPSELPKVNEDTFYIGRVRDFNRFVAAFRRAEDEADALLPARPDAARPVALLPRRTRACGREAARARADRRALDERRPRAAGLAAAPLAGRLHRRAARPVHPPAASRRPLGQVARRRRPRSRDLASAPATCAATPTGRTCPSSRSSRSS